MKRRIIGFLLAVTLLVGMAFPLCSVNAATPSAAEMQSILNGLKSEFYEGRYMDDGWLSANYGGTGCWGFGTLIFTRLFGSWPTAVSARNYDQNASLYIGDWVRVSNDGHTVVIVDLNIGSDLVSYVDCNYGWTNQVHWHYNESLSALRSKITYFYHMPGNYVQSFSPTPGKTTVSVSIPSINTVQVTWNAVANATSYDVYLIQDPWDWTAVKYQKLGLTGTSCTFTGVAYGYYGAFVIARPNADTEQSNWVFFNPVPEPTHATLTASHSRIQLGQSITLNLQCDYATGYYLGVWNGNKRIVDDANSPTTYTFTPTEPGEYSAFFTARNESGYIDSNKIYFTVDEPIGDIDGDGFVTVSDVVALRGRIMDGTADRAVCDLTGDGSVTVSDVITLRRRIVDGK